jgi:predicted phage terminase large subunit-like protein
MARTTNSINLHQLSNDEYYNWRMARWKARTDLGYLCREILDYPDVSDVVHEPIMRVLQKFPLPTPSQAETNDKVVRGQWVYTPLTPMYSLSGGRRALIIDPRGFLKTTINAQSHAVQWILNYPDIAMAVIQSTTEKSQGILRAIKQHFQSNPTFRDLFPDYCPQGRLNDWGTQDYFTVPNRFRPRREHTVSALSIDKSAAGWHFHVMKFSDIVDEQNSKTSMQLEAVIRSFGNMENNLDRPDSWMDVEGTRYDFSDLYGEIMEREQKKPIEKRKWKMHIRGAYVKDTKGKPHTFSPEELALKDKLDANGKKISWWPERWPEEALEDYKREHGPLLHACHKLNNPVDVGDEGKMPFPVNDRFPKWITKKDFTQNIRVSNYTTTVDTAESQTDRADFSVITTVAWSSSGRAFVVDIRRDQWLPDELCSQIILVYNKYRPTAVKIEETSYVRGLKTTLQRFMDLNNVYLPLEFIKRDTQTSKKERIMNTLQPWYKNGELRFVDDIDSDSKEALLHELSRFPRYKHDDILDTLADQYQGREWFGRLQARKTFDQAQRDPDTFNKWLGLEPFDEWVYPVTAGIPTPYDRTGGL